MNIFIFLTLLIKIIMCEYDRRIITTLKYSKYNVTPTIVNGQRAARGDMPYLVSLKEPVQRLDPHRVVWLSICGGSIISAMKVLTAAHCFESKNFYYRKHPQILRLIAGTLRNKLVHSGATETTDGEQWRKIKKVILHYDFLFPIDDIALITVDVPWNFTTGVVDYIIPATRTMDYPKSCYSTGFGTTGHSVEAKLSPVLLQARIDVMSRWQCRKIWQMDMNTLICTDSVVADVGVGDSGGPLACKYTLDPAEEPGKDLLIGVVSGKNYDKTSIFTRVSKYRDWIQSDTAFKPNGRPFLVIITFLILKYPLSHLNEVFIEAEKI